jgi:hypothetical protein
MWSLDETLPPTMDHERIEGGVKVVDVNGQSLAYVVRATT